MPSIVLSPLAQIDLEEIWFYTFREWSAQQADKYQDELFSAFLKIANPKTVRISVNQIRQGYFKHKINRHIIFYRMETNQIIVVRILHEMMDLSEFK